MFKLYTIILCALISLLSINIYTVHKYKKAQQKIEYYASNQKAFILEKNILKNTANSYLFTINQLKYFKDSITSKMLEVTKDLKIKDNKIKSLSYELSTISKKDTILFRDTIFRDKSIDVDTLLSNRWYSLKVGLKYPNKITINPKFISEHIIVTHLKRETIAPPKHFFLFRWFQKKHNVLYIDVKEQNPYIHSIKNKFIKIIK